MDKAMINLCKAGAELFSYTRKLNELGLFHVYCDIPKNIVKVLFVQHFYLSVFNEYHH